MVKCDAIQSNNNSKIIKEQKNENFQIYCMAQCSKSNAAWENKLVMELSNGNGLVEVDE